MTPHIHMGGCTEAAARPDDSAYTYVGGCTEAAARPDDSAYTYGRVLGGPGGCGRGGGQGIACSHDRPSRLMPDLYCRKGGSLRGTERGSLSRRTPAGLRPPIMIESIDAINREVSKHSINGNK